jgi:hypothetical protein
MKWSVSPDARPRPRTGRAGPDGRGNAGRWKATSLVLVGLLAQALGCAPTVNVLGTYFPPSLVCAAFGLISTYLLVRILAAKPALRPLAQSALAFASLTIIMGFLAWWSLFSEF